MLTLKPANFVMLKSKYQGKTSMIIPSSTTPRIYLFSYLLFISQGPPGERGVVGPAGQKGVQVTMMPKSCSPSIERLPSGYQQMAPKWRLAAQRNL